MNRTLIPQDLTRATLAILFIGLLAFGSFWIMRPFLPALLWSTLIVVATWPLMIRFENLLWGSRRLAVIVMTTLLLLVLIVPLALAVKTIAENVYEIARWVDSLETLTVPPPPSWVGALPLIGARLSAAWQEIAGSGHDTLVSYVLPYLPKVAEWFVAEAGGAGKLVLHFFLTVVISAILYSNGELAARGVHLFAGRLAGSQGETATILAARAIRGVALGVVVTALVQSALAGLGLAITGVPAALLLTAVIFMMCLAQLPPALALIAAAIWLYWSGHNIAGTVLLAWSIPVGFLDNFLRPVLIRRGANLPLLLVFAGVLGGLVSLGIIGIFVGPTVLAVTYTLLQSWTLGDQGLPAQPSQAEDVRTPRELSNQPRQ